MSSKKPTNAHDAIMEIINDSRLPITIYCQVEEYEKEPICNEYVDSDVSLAQPSADEVTEMTGWVYRHNPRKWGSQQWVCPACLKREGGA